MKHIALKNLGRIAKEEARLRLLRRQRKDQIKSVMVFVLKYADRLKRSLRVLLLFIIMLLVTTMAFSSAAFAAGPPNVSSETSFAAALGLAGIATMAAFAVGVRYLILGNTASGLITEGKTAGTELISQGKTAGTELLDKGKDEATKILGTDNVKDLVDQLIHSINPLTQVRVHSQAAKEKMELLLKKILKSSSSNRTSSWVADLEEQLSSLGEGNKARVADGLQNVLKALEKDNQGDIDKAFADLTEEDITNMADYVCVSISRPNSIAGEQMQMVSVMEPLCLQYFSLVFVVLILALKLAPFSLYIWIRTKQTFGF